CLLFLLIFFFQAEDGIRDRNVTGVQTCALPICLLGIHQFGGDRVRDGGEQDRNVGDVLCGGLRGRGGNGQHHVQVLACELLSDGQCGGLLAVSVLLVELHVHTGVGEGLLDAGGGGVEGGVLDELVDSDGVRIGARAVGGGSGARGACGGEEGAGGGPYAHRGASGDNEGCIASRGLF